MVEYRVISSDNHVMEPGDLWTGRLESKFRDRAPKIVRFDDGDWWVCEGLKLFGAFGGTQAGLRFEDPEKVNHFSRVEDMRLGAYIPEEQVKDMEAEGIDMGIVYPTICLLLYNVPDSELLTSIFHTYNDWIAEFCKARPERLKGIGVINTDDISVGVKELERCANLGLVGAMITVYPPEERSYDSPEYEPFWAAAQDLSMPISLHIVTNRPGPGQQFVNMQHISPSFFANVDHWVRMSLGHIILSGVFERYPKLQVGSVEMELSWAPHFLDRIDYTYTQRAEGELYGWHRFKEDMLPSDYFHRNVFLAFQEDALGIRDRHIIGVDNLLWGSDYPHQESTFPRSREILSEILTDCTEAERVKIAGSNTARVYGLD